MADAEVCAGCGREREIRVKRLRICGACSSWLYRTARKLIYEGDKWWDGYVETYVDAPIQRYEELYNGGVLEDRKALLLTRPRYAKFARAKKRKVVA